MFMPYLGWRLPFLWKHRHLREPNKISIKSFRKSYKYKSIQRWNCVLALIKIYNLILTPNPKILASTLNRPSSELYNLPQAKHHSHYIDPAFHYNMIQAAYNKLSPTTSSLTPHFLYIGSYSLKRWNNVLWSVLIKLGKVHKKIAEFLLSDNS